MKHSFLLSVLLFLSLAPLAAQTDFDQANTEYMQGRYGDSAQRLQSMVSRGEYSAPIFFNLANAEFKNGRIGAAVLNYLRAGLLSPRDPDIRANTTFALKEKDIAMPRASIPLTISRFLTVNDWAWLGFAGLVLISIGGISRMLLNRGKSML